MFNSSRNRYSPFGELQNGFFNSVRIKNKEETNRKYMAGGHIINFVWDEKAESWLGPWELADWVH